MPVPAAVAESNRTQTDRLHRLVARLTPAMLAVRLPRGWTVADALGRPDQPNLDRGSHREYHLDRIEQALAAAGHRL